MAKDEEKTIQEWLDYYADVSGYPVTLTIPLKTLERINQYMKGKPFKSVSEAIIFLLDSDPEIAARIQNRGPRRGRPNIPLNLEEMDHS